MVKVIYTLGHGVSSVALLVAIAILVTLRFAIRVACSGAFAASPLCTAPSSIPRLGI